MTYKAVLEVDARPIAEGRIASNLLNPEYAEIIIAFKPAEDAIRSGMLYQHTTLTVRLIKEPSNAGD